MTEQLVTNYSIDNNKDQINIQQKSKEAPSQSYEFILSVLSHLMDQLNMVSSGLQSHDEIKKEIAKKEIANTKQKLQEHLTANHPNCLSPEEFNKLVKTDGIDTSAPGYQESVNIIKKALSKYYTPPKAGDLGTEKATGSKNDPSNLNWWVAWENEILKYLNDPLMNNGGDGAGALNLFSELMQGLNNMGDLDKLVKEGKIPKATADKYKSMIKSLVSKFESESPGLTIDGIKLPEWATIPPAYTHGRKDNFKNWMYDLAVRAGIANGGDASKTMAQMKQALENMKKLIEPDPKDPKLKAALKDIKNLLNGSGFSEKVTRELNSFKNDPAAQKKFLNNFNQYDAVEMSQKSFRGDMQQDLAVGYWDRIKGLNIFVKMFMVLDHFQGMGVQMGQEANFVLQQQASNQLKYLQTATSNDLKTLYDKGSSDADKAKAAKDLKDKLAQMKDSETVLAGSLGNPLTSGPLKSIQDMINGIEKCSGKVTEGGKDTVDQWIDNVKYPNDTLAQILAKDAINVQPPSSKQGQKLWDEYHQYQKTGGGSGTKTIEDCLNENPPDYEGINQILNQGGTSGKPPATYTTMMTNIANAGNAINTLSSTVTLSISDVNKKVESMADEFDSSLQIQKSIMQAQSQYSGS